jgi:hypothetical protein
VAPSELYTLRITSVTDPTVTATTAAFSIYETKAITQVTAPPSGGTMTLGQATDIAWTFTGGIHTVRLALKRGGSIIRDIVPSTPCDGAHSWMVRDADGYLTLDHSLISLFPLCSLSVSLSLPPPSDGDRRHGPHPRQRLHSRGFGRCFQRGGRIGGVHH